MFCHFILKPFLILTTGFLILKLDWLSMNAFNGLLLNFNFTRVLSESICILFYLPFFNQWGSQTLSKVLLTLSTL